MTCVRCANTDRLAACVVCARLLCPAHRWGTGALETGYYCVEDCNSVPRVRSPSNAWLVWALFIVGFIMLCLLTVTEGK